MSRAFRAFHLQDTTGRGREDGTIPGGDFAPTMNRSPFQRLRRLRSDVSELLFFIFPFRHVQDLCLLRDLNPIRCGWQRGSSTALQCRRCSTSSLTGQFSPVSPLPVPVPLSLPLSLLLSLASAPHPSPLRTYEIARSNFCLFLTRLPCPFANLLPFASPLTLAASCSPSASTSYSTTSPRPPRSVSTHTRKRHLPVAASGS